MDNTPRTVENLVYDFKIIAKLRKDLSNKEKEKILKEIKRLKNILGVYQVNDSMYIRIRQNDEDLGAACLFYLELKDEKQYFSKLEYYDYIDGETEIAV